MNSQEIKHGLRLLGESVETPEEIYTHLDADGTTMYKLVKPMSQGELELASLVSNCLLVEAVNTDPGASYIVIMSTARVTEVSTDYAMLESGLVCSLFVRTQNYKYRAVSVK